MLCKHTVFKARIFISIMWFCSHMLEIREWYQLNTKITLHHVGCFPRQGEPVIGLGRWCYNLQGKGNSPKLGCCTSSRNTCSSDWRVINMSACTWSFLSRHLPVSFVWLPTNGGPLKSSPSGPGSTFIGWVSPSPVLMCFYILVAAFSQVNLGSPGYLPRYQLMFLSVLWWQDVVFQWFVPNLFSP